MNIENTKQSIFIASFILSPLCFLILYYISIYVFPLILFLSLSHIFKMNLKLKFKYLLNYYSTFHKSRVFS
jgi:hypothetical protein